MRRGTKRRSRLALCELMLCNGGAGSCLTAGDSVPDFDMLEDGDSTEIGQKGVSHLFWS
jgi:hypothetical protein